MGKTFKDKGGLCKRSMEQSLRQMGKHTSCSVSMSACVPLRLAGFDFGLQDITLPSSDLGGLEC